MSTNLKIKIHFSAGSSFHSDRMTAVGLKTVPVNLYSGVGKASIAYSRPLLSANPSRWKTKRRHDDRDSSPI